jgi:5-methylcytosine-specific restriction endonuclease McrA
MPSRFITTADGRRIRDPRSTQAWRRLAKQAAREEPVCWLRFPGVCTGASTTGDHVIPVTIRPDLALIRSNVRGACEPCNTARRNTPVEALRFDRDDPPALGVFG